MKNNSIVIEISHRFIKIVFGYVQNDQIYISYAKKFPTNHFLENGVIKEKNLLIKELSRINPVVDQEYQVNQLINNVNFILPPYGLEIYQTKQMTSVISSERIIGELDIKNIYSIIRNKKLPVDNDLIDIIPEAFVIDNGNMYAQAPIGKSSSAINVFTKVLTIPRRINQEYSDILKSSNIQIDRKIASSFASNELISSYSDTPANYYLIDIGASSTSVSLIGNKQLLATRSFSWGGDNINDRIVSKFNISESEADKIKILYGLDKREVKFPYSVISSEGETGTDKHSIAELNDLIEAELNDFNKMLVAAIEQLAQAYNASDYQSLPLILIGGGARLKGLIPFISEKNGFNNISLFIPKVLGARDPSLVALLGALIIENKYPNTTTKEKQVSVNVAREE